MRVRFKKAFSKAVLAALIVMGFAISAFAMGGEMAGTSLEYSYYDIRSMADGGLGLTDNYFTVTNTSTGWVQAHVRVRTGTKSVELLDFDILLSPKDVFTMDVYQDGEQTVFASCDTKTLVNSNFPLNLDKDGDGDMDCYVIGSSTFPAMISLIQACRPDITATQALEETRKGYVEIIGEGIIYPLTTNKLKCSGPTVDDGTDDVAIAGKTLLNTDSDLSLVDLCPRDVVEMDEVLEGRVYFGTVSSAGTVTRLAQLNAEVLDDYAPLTLHYESYAAEQASARCGAPDAGTCYAYVAAKTSNPADGADDMNYCFYTDENADDEAIANKFGAAATFGPTLADIQVDGQRDGTLVRTASALNYIMSHMQYAYSSYNGEQYASYTRQYADSHYFSSPAPGPYDLSSAFAFIFPFQHFIGEKEIIKIKSIYDNEENTTSTPLDKFISPGLPTAVSLSEEAALFKLTPPFAEGWIRFEITATNSTGDCTETNAGDCETYPDETAADPRDTYVPVYTGAVFSYGAQSMDVSQFQFSNDRLIGD